MFKKLAASVLALFVATAAHAAIVGPLPYTLTNGTTADANQVMANFNKIVADVNNNVIFPSFSQQNYYAAAGGTANALTATLSPTPTSYTPGMVVNLKIASANTDAVTFNANTLGAQNVVNVDGTALKSQQLLAGMVAQLVYDGTQFQVYTLSPLAVRQRALPRTTVLFSTSGSWTFTVPTGVYSVKAEAWGAGGGGGFGGPAGVSSGSGSGGGGGAYGQIYLAVSPGDVLSGVVGASGAGGTSATINGVAGGSTTLLLNGVSQGAVGGGSGGTSVGATANASYVNGGNASGSWTFAASGQNGLTARTGYNGTAVLGGGGDGGNSPRGGVGGSGGNNGSGSPGGNPGGGGGGSSGAIAGSTGGNGWVYLEY